MITEPMKAPREPLTNFCNVAKPFFASFKEDGIRCLTHPTLGPISRSFKPIRNDFIRSGIAEYIPCFLDGEIVILDDGASGTKSFNETQSEVMTIAGSPNYQFRVFDSFLRPNYPFLNRKLDARKAVELFQKQYPNSDRLDLIEQRFIETDEQAADMFEEATDLGKEGLIVRSLTGKYKSGRVTEREGIMFKCVTFLREEATIIGFEQFQQNCNVAIPDNFGRTKRSKHLAGMRALDLLGAFIVRNHWGEFRVSGFTSDQRHAYWQNRASLLNETITYKYKAHGSKDAPRCPIFVGFRNREDI